MQPKKPDRQRSFPCPDLIDQLDPRKHLRGLAKAIPHQVFKNSFRPIYAASGRPAKSARLVVEPLILNHLRNLNNERVVETWVQNQYFQAFYGQQRFTSKLPRNPSEITFSHRHSGEDSARIIFEASVTHHGDKAHEEEFIVPSTVQEKTITFSTDAKLPTKIVTPYDIMASLEAVKLRHSYQCGIKKLLRTICFNLKGHKQDETQRTIRRLLTIADTRIRDMKRKPSPEALEAHQQSPDRYNRAQRQQCSDAGKIYNIHLPDDSCTSKGKSQKKFIHQITWARTSILFSAGADMCLMLLCLYFYQNQLLNMTQTNT